MDGAGPAWIPEDTRQALLRPTLPPPAQRALLAHWDPVRRRRVRSQTRACHKDPQPLGYTRERSGMKVSVQPHRVSV